MSGEQNRFESIDGSWKAALVKSVQVDLAREKLAAVGIRIDLEELFLL
jgi:hypothetical protein